MIFAALEKSHACCAVRRALAVLAHPPSCVHADDILAYCQAEVATDILDTEGLDTSLGAGNEAGPSSPSSGESVCWTPRANGGACCPPRPVR